MTPAALAPLFTPFSGGGLTLKNRFAMAPMTRWKSPDQFPGAEVAAYYRRRAENEVGLLITEGATIDHSVASQSTRIPAFHGRALDGWRRVVDEVHTAGAKIAPQIWHVGAMRSPKDEYPNAHLPSATPSGYYKPGGKQIAPPIDKVEIQAIADSYARAAEAARSLGFDAVEVHGAHGYLIDQFLWDGLNQRDDEYGGDDVARTRFAVEVVNAIRAAIGPDFPLILRISQWKQQDYAAKLAATPDAFAAILKPIADAGVDIFHCSQRRWWEPEFPGSDLNCAGWVKQLTGKPVITVGSVGLAGALALGQELGTHAEASTDIAPLARGVEAGAFDIVAVGRALISDPEWVRKVKQGRLDELRPYDKSKLETLY